MKPARCLFIGGSHDGTWRQVDSDREIIAVPKLAKMKPLVEPKVSETTTAQVSIEEYRREIFREGDRDFVLFVHGSIKPLKIIERLMIGYCPVREGGGS